MLSIVAADICGTYFLPAIVATSARAVELLHSHRTELGAVGGFAAAPEIEAESRKPRCGDRLRVIAPARLLRGHRVTLLRILAGHSTVGFPGALPSAARVTGRSGAKLSYALRGRGTVDVGYWC